ncbi:3-ketoacyl-ACP reductase [archaeon SCG-AAA382B04]|nr:3-ketoacyl-ACP reductase [archaeon SCG-AAA382B04]
MRLKDKVGIVTGGSSGIGREICLKFAEEGAKVVNADVRKEPREGGEPVTELIRNNGGDAIYIETDVTKKESVKQLVNRAIEEFGKIDILVNNAGVYYPKPLHESSEDDWDKIIDVNLKGTYNCNKQMIKHMLDKDIEGKIVNIASIASIVGWENSPAYCASKGGVLALTRELALDYAKKGININAISPGVIKTQMTKAFREDEEMHNYMKQSTPYKRLGEPKDIAHAALYLASEESNFVNGANLVVDGGWTTQ